VVGASPPGWTGETPSLHCLGEKRQGKILLTLQLARMMYLSFLRWSGDKAKVSIAQNTETEAKLRCISCGATPASAARTFVAPLAANCWNSFSPDGASTHLPLTHGTEVSVLKRRTSRDALDQSGVWRFRELLPHIANPKSMSSRCAKATRRCTTCPAARARRCRESSREAPGHEPDLIVQRYGMTVAASSAHQADFAGSPAPPPQHFSFHGCLRRAWQHEQPGVIPDGKISWGKLSQSLDYGALTCQLRTDFDGCVRILNELVRQKPVYLLNSVNPYRIEGQKTAAIELMEQLAWEPPDHIIVPGGNLGNSSAIGKALLEMRELKLISRLPKLSIIRRTARIRSTAVCASWREEARTMTADTLATAIRIGNPGRGRKRCECCRRPAGRSKRSRNLKSPLPKPNRRRCIGCEPASAVTLAGLKKLRRSGFANPARPLF